MADFELKGKISLDDQATPKLEAFGGKLGSFKTAALGAASALGGIGLLKGVKDLTDAASEAEAETAKMDAILKTMGESGAKARDSIMKASQSVTRLGFDDEAAATSMAKLYQRTGDVETAMKLNATAMDLARFKNIDLESASKAVGLVLSGNTKVLKELGIQVDDTKTPMEQLGEAQRKLAGQAESYASTSKGQADAMREGFANLKETIGAALLPMLSKLFEAIRPVIEQVSKWVQDHPKLTTAILAGAVALGTLATILPGIIVLIKGFELATMGVKVAMSLLALPPGGVILLVVAAIAAVVAIVITVIKHWEKIVEFINKVLGPVLDWLKQRWYDIRDAVKDVIEWFQGAIDKIGQAIQKAHEFLSIKGAGNFFGNVFSSITGMSYQGQRAEGGPVSGGSVYMVGERGPEFFVPGVNGTIVPNGRGGASVVINLNGGVFTDQSSIQRLGDQLIAALRPHVTI